MFTLSDTKILEFPPVQCSHQSLQQICFAKWTLHTLHFPTSSSKAITIYLELFFFSKCFNYNSLFLFFSTCSCHRALTKLWLDNPKNISWGLSHILKQKKTYCSNRDIQFRLTLLFTLFIYAYIEYRQLANLSGENVNLFFLLPLSLCDLHVTADNSFSPTSYILLAFFPMILNEKADFFFKYIFVDAKLYSIFYFTFQKNPSLSLKIYFAVHHIKKLACFIVLGNSFSIYSSNLQAGVPCFFLLIPIWGKIEKYSGKKLL